MGVYVDELRNWAIVPPTTVPKVFRKGSCHLTADTLEELHEFATRLQLRRAWFQDHPIHPHYDLTPNKRRSALRLGAIFVPAKEQAKRRMSERGLI